MNYQAKNYENLLGTSGLSDNLLKNHFTLYQGYVTNCNKLSDILGSMIKEEKLGTPEFAELNRRFSWEFNGMRLHEYYFENLTKEGKPLAETSELFKKINENFDNLENFIKNFKSIGVMRGIGWVILYFDPIGDKLFNVWVNEHDVGHLSGAKPILVMDVFEHAYLTDYGLKRADYIESFFKAIDWDIVSKRFEKL